MVLLLEYVFSVLFPPLKTRQINKTNCEILPKFALFLKSLSFGLTRHSTFAVEPLRVRSDIKAYTECVLGMLLKDV